MRRATLLTVLLIATACGGRDRATPPSGAPSDETPQIETASVETASVETAEAETAEAETAAPQLDAMETPEPAEFQLEWRRASGAMFRDQISISSAGRLVWVGQVVQGNIGSMHAITLELDPREVQSVRDAIAGADFFALPVQPPPSSIADGTQLTLRIRANDRQHHVRLEEPLPPGAQRIHDAVDAVLTDARRTQLAAAPEAQPEDFDPSLMLD